MLQREKLECLECIIYLNLFLLVILWKYIFKLVSKDPKDHEYTTQNEDRTRRGDSLNISIFLHPQIPDFK